MEIFIVLLVVLVVITLIGHGIWVLFAFILRSLFGSHSAKSEKEERKSELLKACSYVDRLAKRGRISATEYHRLRDQIESDCKSIGILAPYRLTQIQSSKRSPIAKTDPKRTDPSSAPAKVFETEQPSNKAELERKPGPGWPIR